MVVNPPMTSTMVPDIYRIAERRQESPDSFTWVLKPRDGGFVPPFRHGQFNMLYQFGQGEIPISISGDCADRTGFVHTIRAVGQVTRAMAELPVGATVGLRGPFGEPWPVPVANGLDVVVMAGGIGLAPLRPVIYELIKNRPSYGQINILYGARSPEDQIFQDEWRGWKQSMLDIRFLAIVDHAPPSWTGHVGVVTKLLSHASFTPSRTIAMACGPEVMMRFGKDALLTTGVSPERIYLSMERNMVCGVGHCGHCQCGPLFICKDGPVMPWPRIAPFFNVREI